MAPHTHRVIFPLFEHVPHEGARVLVNTAADLVVEGWEGSWTVTNAAKETFGRGKTVERAVLDWLMQHEAHEGVDG